MEATILTLRMKENKKGKTYFTVSYGNGFEVFETLEEAIKKMPGIARFVTEAIRVSARE